MAQSVSRRWFSGALFAPVLAFGAKPGRCDVCDQRLSSRYWTFEGYYCCSQVCVDQLRPTCTVCGKTISGKHLTADGKVFCCATCADSILPKCDLCHKPIRQGYTITRHEYCSDCVEKKPTCFSCGLPAAYPEKLKDGREICRYCMRWAVKKQEHAQKHYQKALRHLQAWTALELKTVPNLQLVNCDRMNALSQNVRQTDTHVSIRGLYSHQIKVTNRQVGFWKERSTEENEVIYLVDHLHDEVFRVAAVHELMHDMIHEHFQRLEKGPVWVQEGICQQVAAEYCRRRNYVDILHGIENCEDPDYGGGYRYIKKITGFHGWPALKRWMETVDVESLPKTAPK